MREIDLLESFPKSKKEVEKGWRTEENRRIAKRFDKEFFDGERVNGYGGYVYDGRWKGAVKKMQEIYKINSNSSVLDIGCGKGFLLYDLQDMIPGIQIAGIDISNYAINHTMDGFGNYIAKNDTPHDYSFNSSCFNQEDNLEESAKRKIIPHIIQGSVEKLPWIDNSFDVVLSVDTIHNLPLNECEESIKEIMRVCRPNGNMFIKVDAYRNNEEKERMNNWVLTAKTAMSVENWLKFFEKIGYDGDYSWTTF
ncbi:MAG: class I SAM-dependent methyltransferase [Nanoarchaeota archaeon]|nr:class I SAM-dependent methyltransferase [Nanoarchaeota archaeon]